MSTVITPEDADRQSITELLHQISIEKVRYTSTDGGRITAAAVYLLSCGYHFLRWNGNVLRTADEVADIISPGSFARDARAATSDADLSMVIYRVLQYSTRITKENEHAKVVGLYIAVGAMQYALYQSAFELFLSMLDWKVFNLQSQTTDLQVVETTEEQETLLPPLVDGFMAAMTMYPEVQQKYAVKLGDTTLIPIYDSETQIMATTSRWTPGVGYRMLVPGAQFAGHYVDDIIWQNYRNRTAESYERNHLTDPTVELPLTEGYLHFTSLKFLQGFMSMTNSISITQLWLPLEIYHAGQWKPASILVHTTYQ